MKQQTFDCVISGTVICRCRCYSQPPFILIETTHVRRYYNAGPWRSRYDSRVSELGSSTSASAASACLCLFGDMFRRGTCISHRATEGFDDNIDRKSKRLKSSH